MIQESVLSGKFIMTRQLILQGIAFVVKLKDSKNVPFVAPYQESYIMKSKGSILGTHVT